MKIYIAKTSGFCMGVRRAVEMSLDVSNSSKGPISTYGPLIHNPQVLNLLKEKGISVIEQIPDSGSGSVLIRAHGVPPEAKKMLVDAGYGVKDATCPRVIRVQTIIRKHAAKGYATIIAGDADHPEVIGLLGYSGGNGYVVNSVSDLSDLPLFEKAIIVAQTTQNTQFFDELTRWAENHRPHYKRFNTICDSTEKRQNEVKSLARKVDMLIVVGGKNSGNTQRLAEVAREAGIPACHIEDDSELDAVDLQGIRSIGITAGASTPNWIIKQVLKRIESFQRQRKQRWRSLAESIQQAFLYTNLYIAFGAACLTYASTTLQGIEHRVSYIVIAFLYVLSMHTFNNLIGRQSDQFNDPGRAGFCETHKYRLAVLAFLSGGIGLITACRMGIMPFLLLTVMSIMGLLYTIRLVPNCLTGFPYHRISEIPGSKTILIVVAWGIVTSIFPALSETRRITMQSVWVFFWILGVVFVRTAFFDILAMQGDRIVGTKTLPIILGERKTRLLLKRILIASFCFLLMAGVWGGVFQLSLLLSVLLVLMAYLVLTNKHSGMFANTRQVFWMEASFVLAGFLTHFYGK